MKALRVSLFTLLTLGSAVLLERSSAAQGTTGAALPPGWQGKLAALVPQPGQSVQPMEQRSDLALVELQRRVTEVNGSRDALRSLMISFARGERPEYDERLGITREEFQRYLVFRPVLVPAGKPVRLNVARDGNLLKFGDAPGALGVLRGLVLDLGTAELRTPEGFASKPRALAASTAADRSIDIRGGFEWNVKGNNPVTQNGVKAQLQLLQLPGNQVVLIYYRFGMLRGVISEGRVIVGYDR